MHGDGSRPLRVALFADSSGIYGRELLYGVARYIREHRPWDLYVVMGTAEDPSRIKDWDGDGLIARMRSNAVIQTISTMTCPKVLFDWYPDRPHYQPMLNAAGITHNSMHAAEAAVEYFRARGYRRLAFVRYGDWRAGCGLDEPFAQVAARELIPCAIYHPTDPAVIKGDYRTTQEDLARWLSQQPRPLAVWAANDLRGLDVVEACRLASLRVPEDVAVLGHNNDDLVCELCNPPLSSIVVPYIQMGYDAAELLDRMIAGEPPPTRTIEYPTTCVVTRQSTDIVAVDDVNLADALRFIRANAVKKIDVEDVVESAHLSRSTLQRRFQTILGRTPAEEIDRVRVERAKELLAYTRLAMPQIAERCGFSNSPRLSEVFRRVTGHSPSAFRRQHQTHDDYPQSESLTS